MLSKELIKKGNQIAVAVPKYAVLKQQWDLPKQKIKKIFIPNFDYRQFFKSKKDSDGYNSSSILWRIKESFLVNLLLGDGGIIYSLSGFFKLKNYIIRNPTSIIYSSYRPLSDLVISYLLKKRFKNIFWICDFRDIPVDELHKNFINKNFASWFYKKLIRSADLVTAVSKGVASSLLTNNVSVIYNGINEVTQLDQYYPDEKFHITYTGSLHEFQTIIPMIQSLEQMQENGQIRKSEIVIHYAGKDFLNFENQFSDSQLKNTIVNHGLLSYDQSRNLQNKSDLNLMLSWNLKNNQGIITGKLFDYLGIPKPILCICNGPIDIEIKELFEQYNLGCFFSSEDSDIAKMVQFLTRVKSVNFERKEKQIMRDFNWEEAANQLISLSSS